MRAASEKDGSIRPDLLVGPGGIGATHLLAELWPEVPIVNCFDWFHQVDELSDDVAAATLAGRMRARTRSALGLLDLEAMSQGWVPTAHQRSLFPSSWADALAVIPEAVDIALWDRVAPEGRTVAHLDFSGRKLVTFVIRPGEPGPGLDAILPLAQRLLTARDDLEILVVGGAPESVGGAGSQDVSAVDQRLHRVASMVPSVLRRALSLSDLHVHRGSVHSVAWSLLDAMACGAPVLATDNPAVREVAGAGGAELVGRDLEATAARALELLDDPERARRLGEQGRSIVRDRHSLDVVIPQLLDLWSAAMEVDRDVFEPSRS